MSQDKSVIISLSNIKKNFYSTQALDDVGLEVCSGEVVGLIGENGSGKSTLLKIILGVHPQSSGEMFMRGEPYAPKTPKDANTAGIGMVFQEQSLIVNLSVGQNIFFGQEPEFRKHGFVNWNKMYAEAKRVLESIGIGDIHPGKRVADLNFATRQMVEIAKVVNLAMSSHHEKCLIMFDEPTSVLNESETQTLFEQIRMLTSMGHGVIFVSHRLDEVLEISDRVYVLKDGKSMGDMPVAEANEDLLYSLMVGKTNVSEHFDLSQQTMPGEEIVLEVENLGLKGVFKDVNFKLHKGEVLGFCGVVGSGKEDICDVLCGDQHPDYGTITVRGKRMRLSPPSAARKQNILMIPKERLAEGVIVSLSVGENIHLSSLPALRSGMLLSKKKAVSIARKHIDRLRIKTTGENQLLLNLSGGNQQKVIFARAIASECDIIILNHPTRGVDVGARQDLYAIIREIVNQGASVILLGDTLEECIGMSSRIIVMKDGLIAGEFEADVDHKPTQLDILQLMM